MKTIMIFPSIRMLALAVVVAAGYLIPPVVRAQDPVDQAVSPEVRRVEAGGAKADSAQWHNLENFIHEKTKEGLRGKALGDAVKQERERLGLTGLDRDMVKKMREYELNQEKIERLDQKITALKARLGEGNMNDSKIRSMAEQKLKNREEEKKALEKRSGDILAELGSAAKY